MKQLLMCMARDPPPRAELRTGRQPWTQGSQAPIRAGGVKSVWPFWPWIRGTELREATSELPLEAKMRGQWPSAGDVFNLRQRPHLTSLNQRTPPHSAKGFGAYYSSF